MTKLSRGQAEGRYRKYVSDSIADTDGYYAPISFEHWLKVEGIELRSSWHGE